MMTETEVKKILDTTVKDVSQRLGKLEVLDNYEGSVVSYKAPYNIYVTTNGDFQKVFSFCIDRKVLEAVAENMMHRTDVSEEAIYDCAREFFNILCGRAISSINGVYKTKTRFSIPVVEAGVCQESDGQKIWIQCSYRYSCGAAQFTILKMI